MLPFPLLLALAGVSFGFAPTNEVMTGIEPQRVRWERGPVQAAALRSDAFTRFLASDGAGWQARFDEATGTPRVLWGRGIAVRVGSESEVARDVAAVLERHRALIGFETLALADAGYDAQYDTWYLDFHTPREGMATYRGGISARVKHGRLVLLQVATSPDAPVVGTLRLAADDAITRAIADGPAPNAVHTERSAEPILLERSSLAGRELVRTWQVRTRTASPPGIWVTFVDAANGAILSAHNEVRFATGTVSALHHERNADSPLVLSPLGLVEVEGDVDSYLTGADGFFEVTDSLAYATDLHGTYVDVDNAAGTDAVLASAETDLLWATESATQAEIDTYVFLHHVKTWGERVAPTNGWVTGSFESTVNIDATCNAYWDGNTNFYRAGDGCNNTGENGDIAYHEWGHGFHAYSLEAGFFDGSLSEGAADVVAFLQTGDNLIAPFFGTDGWAIRDVAPNQVYPQDYVDQDLYVHYNGLIFGGAMWDLRTLLVAEYGEAPGIAQLEWIFAGLLKGGTDIPGTLYEAFVADDDDGDLGNGTPNQCTILDAFGQHGLGSLAGGGFALLDHVPVVTAPADVPTPIALTVGSFAPLCVTVVPDVATVHFRVDGGAWELVDADVAGDDVAADIPGQPYGSFVEYWIEGDDTNGDGFSV
ncbi:MAG: hypothetical protein H0V89_07405, partial [Deltaproteobacteria bacterium]|nr:hypothetical protein [Deltaproteobacteria bacterium]